jgi:DNA-binding transcriptional MerR regulator
MSGLTIGAVAKQAGVNIDTLRYYERQGVVVAGVVMSRPDRN